MTQVRAEEVVLGPSLQEPIPVADLPEVGRLLPGPIRAHMVTPAERMMTLIERAVLDPAFDVSKLEQLLAVKERWEKQEAKAQFIAAMAAFKAEPVTVQKSKHVKYAVSDGAGKVDFYHATLGSVVEAIGPALGRHGLAHRWEVEQGNGGLIKVTCVLMHGAGHEERVMLTGMPDTSGKKNAIQQVGSTVTYLQRYTLMAATGMASVDQDDDGAGGSEAAPPALDSARSLEIKKQIEACKAPSELRELWISLKPEEQAAMENVKEAHRRKLVMPARKSESA